MRKILRTRKNFTHTKFPSKINQTFTSWKTRRKHVNETTVILRLKKHSEYSINYFLIIYGISKVLTTFFKIGKKTRVRLTGIIKFPVLTLSWRFWITWVHLTSIRWTFVPSYYKKLLWSFMEWFLFWKT